MWGSMALVASTLVIALVAILFVYITVRVATHAFYRSRAEASNFGADYGTQKHP
jgi:hypothetical protein